MKKTLLTMTIACAILLSTSIVIAGSVKGNAEEYHYALNLCYQHTADHAKALFAQAQKGEMNIEIAKDFVDQISSDLDHARIYHAMVHKTYSEADSKLIADDHLTILNGQSAASAAIASLKSEIEKSKPDAGAIKTLSATIFNAATKAVNAHLDAMKKLGIPEPQAPAL
ncbi:MAG TPA: hypothetical protein VMH23_03585 [Bacteroidota bacterium]|nr:hypothetical protein [Bacteroidota bacterium]